MSSIGVVIVTHNSAREIGDCLDAVLRTSADVVVVDNASTDATRDEVQRRGVRMIANAENRGFAGAVNQGFAVLSSEYIVLLNPDAVLVSGLEPLRDACELPGSAGAGGRLVDPAGHPQLGFMVRRLPTPAALILEALLLNRMLPMNPVNRRYRMFDTELAVPQAVEQPAGAFLMLRRAVWEELGGLDEGFFPIWFEDVDICRRILDRGYSLRYAPDAVAKHTGGHSILLLGVEKRQYYWYRSLLRYSAKHFRPPVFRAVCLAVFAGSIVRGIGGVAVERSLKSIAVQGKVAGLAGRCFLSGWREN